MDKSIRHLPPQLQGYREFRAIHDLEDIETALQAHEIGLMVDNNYFLTADETGISAFEKALKIEPKGNLEQRRSFLLALAASSEKFSSKTIKNIVEAITGGKVLVTFFGADESENPYRGYGFIDIKVLSPALDKDYNFSDVERLLKPKIPAHLKYKVSKWFATWKDINDGFTDWQAMLTKFTDWQEINDFIPKEV
ncbi:MAG: putative phage tail protein [Filifactoraceae bacterium]